MLTLWQITGNLTDEDISPYDWLNIANCARERSRQAFYADDSYARFGGEFVSVRAACGKAAG